MTIPNQTPNRTPEDLVRELSITLAWLTECNLATLERLQGLKKSSKYEISRQQEICDISVLHCKGLGVKPIGLRGRACTRLEERLTAK